MARPSTFKFRDFEFHGDGETLVRVAALALVALAVLVVVGGLDGNGPSGPPSQA